MGKVGRQGGSMVYQWKAGSRIGTDPQKVGAELEKIPLKDASNVVAAARKSRGELHRCFEWDDAKAGEEYRKEQARLILRMLVTPEEREDDGEVVTTMVRAYESVRFATPSKESGEDEPDKNMTYVPLKEALSDPELRAQIMGRLDSTISEAQTTAENYSYLAPVLRKTATKLREAGATLRS